MQTQIKCTQSPNRHKIRTRQRKTSTDLQTAHTLSYGLCESSLGSCHICFTTKETPNYTKHSTQNHIRLNTNNTYRSLTCRIKNPHCRKIPRHERHTISSISNTKHIQPLLLLAKPSPHTQTNSRHHT